MIYGDAYRVDHYGALSALEEGRTYKVTTYKQRDGCIFILEPDKSIGVESWYIQAPSNYIPVAGDFVEITDKRLTHIIIRIHQAFRVIDEGF